MELHVHLFDVMIIRISLRLSLVQLGESFSIPEESSSNTQATNLALIFFFPLTIFSVSTHLVVTVFWPLSWFSSFHFSISWIFASKISCSEHWVAKKIFSHLSFIKHHLFILLQLINWIVSSDMFKVLKRCLYLPVALPALDIWHLFHSFSFSNWNFTYWLGFRSL